MVNELEEPGVPTEETAPPAAPRHRLAEPSRWPWLPKEGSRMLARHAWCVDCGEVRVTGSARAMPFGGLMNLLGRLEHRFSHHGIVMTEAQRRLIVKGLEALGVDDTFGLPREKQLHIFTTVVARYVGLAPAVVQTYLRSC